MGLNPQRITGTTRLTSSAVGGVLFLVDHDQNVQMLVHPLPEDEKLVAMQQAVGGRIEHVHIGASRHRQFVVYDGWVNEEGLLQGLPLALRLRVSNGVMHTLVPVAGSLLVTAGETLSGETVALTPNEIHDLALLTMSDGTPIVSVSPELPDA